MKKINKAPKEKNDLSKAFYLLQIEVSSYILANSYFFKMRLFVRSINKMMFSATLLPRIPVLGIFHPPE